MKIGAFLSRNVLPIAAMAELASMNYSDFKEIHYSPEFTPDRHTKKSYAAQNREAKRRRKASLHNQKIKSW